jgi:hypothetical protein
VKLYSDFAGRRGRQVVGDVVAVVVVVVGIIVAVTVGNAIAALASIGVDIENSGTGFSGTMSDIGETLSGVPLIGGGISGPFDTASGAGDALASAGSSWQDGVTTAASVAGWIIALIVIAIVALVWVAPRVVGIRRATVAARLAASPSSLDLLALRALTTRRLDAIAGVGPHAATAWRQGDPEMIRRLAALELRAAGVRLPASG